VQEGFAAERQEWDGAGGAVRFRRVQVTILIYLNVSYN
jgi:hypothetical protein